MTNAAQPNDRLRRVYLTGASGFVGTWLRRVAESESALELFPASPQIDLLDTQALTDELAHCAPDAVIHLAAQASVAQSLADPLETCRVNYLGTASLLQALRKVAFSGRLLYVSSGEVYGDVDAAHLPITENQPAMPRSPYAASKLAAELLCQQWARVEPMPVVIARPFNHIGPGQDRRFALADFAAQITAMPCDGQTHKLVTGDLDVTRDFLDVRDVARAYIGLLTQGHAGETYNVCSGHEHRLHDLVVRMAEIAGVRLELTLDSARARPAQQRRVAGDNRKLSEHTGWRPATDMSQSLVDLLQHARTHPSP